MTALTFKELENAYIMIYENAKELLEESKLLYEHERYARAYFLAQICYEETAKLPIVFQEATRSHFKETHDWKEFYKRLRSHNKKNMMNVVAEDLINFPNREYEEMKKRAEALNTLKNASLYSDLDNSKFTKPSKVVDRENTRARIDVAESYLEYTSLPKFHIKGNMKRNLSTESAKRNRKMMEQMGLKY